MQQRSTRVLAAVHAAGRLPVVVVCLALLLPIAVLDAHVDPLLALSAFYTLPVLVAGARDALTGYGVAVVTAGTWLWVDLVQHGQAYGGVAVPVANAAMRATTFAVVVALLAQLHRRVDHERDLSRLDPLTGLGNTRAFYEQVESARRTLVRTGRPLTVAYLDVDDFKGVNDRLGHAAGDEVLRCTGEALVAAVRAVDTVARLGGDEFGVLLPETDEQEAAVVLERVRQRLRSVGQVRVSIGGATFTEPEVSVDDIVARADRAMYEVKRGGKDGVRLVSA